MTNIVLFMQWKCSKLQPPLWWQLSLDGGMLEAFIQHKTDGCYYAFVGRGERSRVVKFYDLPSAKVWAVEQLRLSVAQIQAELQPNRSIDKLWVYLGSIAIALFVAWRILL